jgi:biopolymer transport protein ExbD
VPVLNTASLPDLIFTVLFFFMIVTHMRNESVKVDYHKPEGTELTRLVKKSSVIHVHIGTNGQKDQNGHLKYFVQMNDKIIAIEDVADYVKDERARMSPTELEQSIVSIKADKQTPMGIITEVKRSLREAKAYKISYSADNKREKNN